MNISVRYLYFYSSKTFGYCIQHWTLKHQMVTTLINKTDYFFTFKTIPVVPVVWATILDIQIEYSRNILKFFCTSVDTTPEYQY